MKKQLALKRQTRTEKAVFESIINQIKKQLPKKPPIPEYQPQTEEETELFETILELREEIKRLQKELKPVEEKAIEKAEEIWKETITEDQRINSIRVCLPAGSVLFTFKNQEARITNPELLKLKLKKHYNNLVQVKRTFKIKENKAEELFNLLGAEKFMEFFEVEEELVTVPDFRKKTALLGIDCSDCVALPKPTVKTEARKKE